MSISTQAACIRIAKLSSSNDPHLHLRLVSSLPSPWINLHVKRSNLRIGASRRTFSYNQEDGLARDTKGRGYDDVKFDELGDAMEEVDEGEEEENDRSLDLFVRFMHNVFLKISRRARKAVRSMLPRLIPSKLVNFAVNGTIILAFLWVLKAFLQVACTLGTIVFVSILVTRGVWFGLTYRQAYTRNYRSVGSEDDNNAWDGAQPAT